MSRVPLTICRALLCSTKVLCISFQYLDIMFVFCWQKEIGKKLLIKCWSNLQQVPWERLQSKVWPFPVFFKKFKTFSIWTVIWIRKKSVFLRSNPSHKHDCLHPNTFNDFKSKKVHVILITSLFPRAVVPSRGSATHRVSRKEGS